METSESNSCQKKAVLKAIEGLDVELGLQYAANNLKLYEMLLKAFVANNRDASACISAAMSAGDRETARRTAHSLKGVAATIGASELHEAAKALEDAIVEKQERGAVELARVEQLLDALIYQMDRVFVEGLEPDSP